MSTDYDKDLINREVIAVCDHYLTDRKGEGKRQTYLCPACGDRNFEVDPDRGYAGCFDAGCEAPTTTDALGVLAYFEGKSLSGEGFVMCLKKGYEILGIAEPQQQRSESANGDRQKAMTARKQRKGSQREKAMTPRKDRASGHEKAMTPRKDRASGHEKAMTPRDDRRSEEGVSDNAHGSVNGSGSQWGAATSSPVETSESALLEQPIQAWQENEDGTTVPVAAVVIRESETEDAKEDDGEELEDADLADDAVDRTEDQTGQTDERQSGHEVFEELLKLCRREERDERFLTDRGLDEETIKEGYFGSISKSRCNYVLDKLRKKFSEEELLSVPGFHRTEGGKLRFSLYGDYALIPYFDNEGYIRTVEGRFTGEEMGEYDKKYKALLNSAVHLYVHPRFNPDEVVAICEGAIGAMVAARYGIAVASIKGFRNYRRRVDGDGNLYTVLPELEGVDFAGKVVVYIPDVDVKPASYESVMKTVPDACHWMIERQGGVPKVAMLPEGAKDLDAWILSLHEEEREERLAELLGEAMPVEQFKQEYLNTEDGQDQVGFASRGGEDLEEYGENEASQQEDEEASKQDTSPNLEEVRGREDSGSAEPELEEVGGWEDSGGSDPGQQDSDTTEEGNADSRNYGSGESTYDTDSFRNASRVHDTGGGTNDGKGSSSWEQLQLGVERTGSEDSDDTGELKTTEETTSELDVSQYGQRGGEDQTEKLEPEPAPELEQDHPTPGPAYHVCVKGEKHLYVLAYVVAAIILSVVAWLAVGGWLSWAGSVVLGAGLAIWVTVGFGKLHRWYERRQLRRHIEGD